MKIASPHSARQQSRPLPKQAVPVTSTGEEIPRASRTGTGLCLTGLAITGLTLSGHSSENIASYAAVGAGLSLMAGMAADVHSGWRNLARADLMALLALYFLTFVEFLFPQTDLLTFGTATTRMGVTACLIAYGGLSVGRHLVWTKRHPLSNLCQRPAPNAALYFIFWTCFVLGFLYMVVAVNFDIPLMMDYLLAPRFSQPWGRGRLGDWKALLVEVAAIVNLVPPLGGILLARRQKHSKSAVYLIALALLFTFFYGFSTGTRNVFASYLVTFLIGYALAANWTRQRRELIGLCFGVIVVLFVSTKLMLDFRTIGLKEYVTGGYYSQWNRITKEKPFSVDNNLNAVCGLVDYFPKHHKYLGWEVPYIALIHPIPRALWAGKPEKMSMSVEEVFDVGGWTISTTFVGEAIMMGGMLAVFATAVVLGALFSWWNLLASSRNSEFGMLIYASGFAAAIISMRSMQWLSTTILPTIGGIIAGHFLIKGGKKVVAKISHRSRAVSIPAPIPITHTDHPPLKPKANPATLKKNIFG